MATRKLYPIGIQTFEVIRNEDRVYVDKTELVYRLTHGDAKYVFLSRPRRFGKSLLISTLMSYFEGRKDLFKGLAMEQLEEEWKRYPVLRFDMSTAKHMGVPELESELNLKLSAYEAIYGKNPEEQNLNQRLMGLIIRANEQTGNKVVVLIDEYDAPLLDVMHEDKQLPLLRQVMRNFYSPLKACDPYLHFVFLTGITKFSQLSIFSELNNIANISMDDEFAAICGITREEMLTQMSSAIDTLAEKNEMSRQEAIDELTVMYDGYHFSPKSPDIFNPYSLINCFSKNELQDFWFESGTPTYIIEMMRKFGVVPSKIGAKGVRASNFDAPTESMSSITPLLYQSGYITIKSCMPRFGLYTLDIPNKEVRVGLMQTLVPNYVTKNTEAVSFSVGEMSMALADNDMDGALRHLQTFLSTVPYCDNTDYEGHWQQVLYIIFTLLGYSADVEVHTATGRVDMMLATRTRLYIVETKIDQSADKALSQINLKDYDKRFALYPHPRVKVGINFDTATHTLSDWKIEE